MKNLILISVILTLLVACSSKPKVKETIEVNDFAMHNVKVEEVIQTSQYSYLRVKEMNSNFWIAVMRDDYSQGAELLYLQKNVTAMNDFHSTELDRDFDEILFVSKVSRKAEGQMSAMEKPQGNVTGSATAHSGRKVVEAESNSKTEKAEGGITIAELYGNKTQYANKKVRIRAKVVKVNNQIMGRNWVHIQDGSKFEEDYDLTITTSETFEVGDIVAVEGLVSLNKDFSSGYFYPVILEEARRVLE